MNRYPLWVYAIVLVVVLVGLVYSVPNLFPESPAVQISAARASERVDEALLDRATGALERAGIGYEDAYLDQNSAKLRFASTDAQLRAKDVIQKELGENSYTVALNLLSNSPRWLRLPR